MPKKMLCPLLLILISSTLNADLMNCRLSGTADCPEPGVLYIFLCDEKAFRKPFTGLCSFRKTVHSPGEYHWRFDRVPEGTYCIRAFLDMNRDGALNKGLFGPSEPWAVSGPPDRPRGRPDFQDICFPVGEDKADIKLVLK